MELKNWFVSHEAKGYFTKMLKDYCSAEWMMMIEHYQKKCVYKKNETIIQEGDPAEQIGIIVSGKVKVFNVCNGNNERILRFATDGQVLGHRGLGAEKDYPISAIALEDTEVLMIPMNVFVNILKANNEFCYHFLLFFTDELRRSENQIKYFTSLEVQQRVAVALIMNYDAFGFDEHSKTKLSYTISRKDIAKLTGSTYESVVRVLSAFNKNKIIRIENKEIYILDMSKLYDLTKQDLNMI